MKNILWYQPANLSDADKIYCNGSKIEDVQERSGLFADIRSISSKVIKYQRPWCGNVNGYYFVKGSFTTKDELGRQLIFMYVSDKKNDDDGLKNIINKIGLELDEDTQNSISTPNHLRSYKTYLYVSLLIALIICLFIIYAK